MTTSYVIHVTLFRLTLPFLTRTVFFNLLRFLMPFGIAGFLFIPIPAPAIFSFALSIALFAMTLPVSFNLFLADSFKFSPDNTSCPISTPVLSACFDSKPNQGLACFQRNLPKLKPPPTCHSGPLNPLVAPPSCHSGPEKTPAPRKADTSHVFLKCRVITTRPNLNEGGTPVSVLI